MIYFGMIFVYYFQRKLKPKYNEQSKRIRR